jgi:2-methylcitrate dehydratase PrpD
MHATRLLAEYVDDLRPESLTDDVREAAIRCVLDLIGAAAAGYRSPSVEGVRKVVRAQYGAGPAEVWFTGERRTALGAVFCNSAAASVLDLDDGVRAARGHPGAAVIPAAFAVAAEANATAAELLAAIVAGYEVGVRVARARRFHSSSGTWSAHGAIAAAARLRGTKPEQLAHALAIATLTSPMLKGRGEGPHYTHLSDSDVKEGIPWASVTGMTSLALAEAGHTGPMEILDSSAYFERASLVEGLVGSLGDLPLIGQTYFKPYACCRHIHAPLDAFGSLLQRQSIAPDDIAAVEVYTYAATLDLNNLVEPRTCLDAQFSVPYCLGIYAFRGAAGLLPLDDDVLEDHAIRAFAKRVTLHVDPNLTARFPAETLSRVVIQTAHARFESPVTTPFGDVANPMSRADLEAKFRQATRNALSPEQQNGVLQAIDHLRAGELQPLRQRLADCGRSWRGDDFF